jgi:hypothetical protein
MEFNSIEKNLPIPNPANTSLASDVRDDTNEPILSQQDTDDRGFDEPTCDWKPLGRDGEDCGEGVNCPPCG